MEISREAGANLLRRVQADPHFFAREVVGGDPWSKQIEIMQALMTHRRIAVRSCHAIGKSFITAMIVLWFLFAHRPSLVVTTAPTLRQVKEAIWGNIRKLHASSKHPLGGRMLLQEYQLGEGWHAFGFTAPDYDPNKFQGLHHENMLVIVDEAAGVSEKIYSEGITAITTGDAYLLLIGNPTCSREKRFARAFTDPDFAKFKVSAFDTPNFTEFGITQEDIENDTWKEKVGDAPMPRKYLITPRNVAEWWKAWGRSVKSPMYQAKVLAEFPDQGDDTLIPMEQIIAAQERELPAEGPLDYALDPARYGDCETVLMQRKGPVARVVRSVRGWNTMRTAGLVRNEHMLNQPRRIRIDTIGLGSGIYDRLEELRVPGLEEFLSSESPFEEAGVREGQKQLFLNRRAQAYWELRTAFDQEEIDIDPTDDALAGQLAMIKYEYSSKGEIKIWSKEKFKKEGIPSPDRADALAMLWAPGAGNAHYVVFW